HQRDGGSQGLGHPDLVQLRPRDQARPPDRHRLLPNRADRLRPGPAGGRLRPLQRDRNGLRQLRQGLEGDRAGQLGGSLPPNPLSPGLDRWISEWSTRYAATRESTTGPSASSTVEAPRSTWRAPPSRTFGRWDGTRTRSSSSTTT